MTAVLRRLLAVLALAFTAAYLLPAWMCADGLPWSIRFAWPLAAGAAALWPSASWLAFVAGAPLLPIVPSLQEWPAVSLLAMWLFALLAPAWARLAWRPEGPARGHWAALFLLLTSASLVASMAPLAAQGDGLGALLARLHEFFGTDFVVLEGQRHLFASALAWFVMAEGVGMGWLAARFLRARGEAGAIQMAVAAVTGATLVAAWGIRQWWTRDNLLPFWREFDPFIVRVNASFTDVNALGSYLASMAVLALALAATTRDAWRRLAGLAVTVAIAVALVFTGSRTAWAAMAVGAALYALLAWRSGAWGAEAVRSAARLRRVVAPGALVLALALAALVAYATAIDARHVQQRSYFDTVLHTLNLRVPPADKLKGRLPLWAAASRMIEARPLTGIGVGRYYKDVSLYTEDDGTLIRPQENAHNYFLQLAAESGLPTLVAWLLLIVTAVAASWRASLTAPPVVRHLVCGGIGGLAAFLFTCLTGHPLLLREGQYAFWVLLAIAGAAAVVRQDGPGPRGERALAAAVGLVVVLSLPWRAGAEMAAVDLSRLPSGVYEVELAPDGSSFRWTHDRATFHVPASSRRVEFSVRTLAPVPQTVDVLLAGERVERLVLDDHAWRDVRYVLPAAGGDRRFVELVLVVAPTWRAGGDPRELGVMVRGLAWSR